MTTITLPRATVKQALEALEGSAGILQHEHVWPGAEKKSRFVIAALRAALAQQDEPVQETEFWGRVAARQASRIKQLETAAQQALEALAIAWQQNPHWQITEGMHALRAALAQQDEPVQVAERERVASQWDGCVTHQLDTFGPVDIGASIRAGELVEAQQAEPLTGLDMFLDPNDGLKPKPYKPRAEPAHGIKE